MGQLKTGSLIPVTNYKLKQCIHFSFGKVIQNELDDVRERWNTHYIRRSRHNTQAGIPDEMFFLPESFNTADYKEDVTD